MVDVDLCFLSSQPNINLQWKTTVKS